MRTFVTLWFEILFILCIFTKVQGCKILNNFPIQKIKSSSESHEIGSLDTPNISIYHDNVIVDIDL